jgi:hypothetical protein
MGISSAGCWVRILRILVMLFNHFDGNGDSILVWIFIHEGFRVGGVRRDELEGAICQALGE